MAPAGLIENITHVAEAAEHRGRLVLQVRSRRPNRAAIMAVMKIARAFGASIESILVEDEQLFNLAGYAFVQEIGLSGGALGVCEAEGMSDRIAAVLRAARRDIEMAALQAEVVHVSRVVRGDPWKELAVACLDQGPWNIVALMDPLEAGDMPALRHLLRQMAGMTGVIVTGPKACRSDGPIIIAVEDAGRLAQKLNLAMRIGGVDQSAITILPLGVRAEHLDLLDEQIRLVLGDSEGVRIAAPAMTLGSAAVAAELLRRYQPGLVIAEFGHIAVPEFDDDIRPLLKSLECPLILVR